MTTISVTPECRNGSFRLPEFLSNCNATSDSSPSSSRLNVSDSDGEPLYIQMVTALVFQLIQCVVHLPTERDAEDDRHKKVSTSDSHVVSMCGSGMFHILCDLSRWIKMFSSQTLTKPP